MGRRKPAARNRRGRDLARGRESEKPRLRIRRRAANPVCRANCSGAKVSPRAAQDLVAELDLRNMTGGGDIAPGGYCECCGNRSKMDKMAAQISR